MVGLCDEFPILFINGVHNFHMYETRTQAVSVVQSDSPEDNERVESNVFKSNNDSRFRSGGETMSESKTAWRKTGISKIDAAVCIDGIHILGVLHTSPMAIARVTGAITRYEPDVVAIEACGEAVRHHHPDYNDPLWPPRDEMEAAAFVTERRQELIIAGIDTVDYDSSLNQRFAEYDAEILTDMGIIESPEDLTGEAYYELDLSEIRTWREETAQRDPDAFQAMLTDRDKAMAGHLVAIADDPAADTIVAAVGLQHVTGILDFVQDPSQIPEEYITLPPVSGYHTI